MSKPTAIDLFCGAGGCSEGLLQAGYDILFSSDISPMAGATYMNRHTQLGYIQGVDTWFECEDICNITGDLIWNRIRSLERFKSEPIPKTIDLMIGGPSCQGFSRAGKRDKEDPRNKLFGEYVRVISEIKPRYIVLENVEGFMDMQFNGYIGINGTVYADGTVTPNILTAELNEIGYNVIEPKVLNAYDYGVPQRRKRVIFIGYRKGEKAPEYPTPLPENKKVTLADALDGLFTVKQNCVTEYQAKSIVGRTPRKNAKCDLILLPISTSSPKNMEMPNTSALLLERFSLFEQGENVVALRKRIKSVGIDLSSKYELLALCTTKLNKSEQDIISMFKSGNVSDHDIDVLLTKKQMRQRLSLKDPAATVII